MQIIGRPGGFRWSWICSCGESNETYFDYRRVPEYDSWKAAAGEAFDAHGIHVREARL